MVSTMGMGFIITCIFVACVGFAGVFTMFAKPENIERPMLVGALTISTMLLAVILLDHDARIGSPVGTMGLIWIALIAVLGFGIGKLIDTLMGPRSAAFTEDSTLGSDLSD